PGVGASPLFGDIDPEPPGEIDQPGPMGVVEWDTGDSAPLKGVTLGVTGEEDAVDSWGAGCRANPVGQGGGLAREDIASRQMGRIEGQEEEMVADHTRWAGLTASPSRKAAGPDVEDEAQSESLVGLCAAERQDRAHRRLIQHGRVGGRLTVMIQQPA